MAPPKFEEVYSPERGRDPAAAGQSRSADPYHLPNMIIDIESSDQLLGYLRATKRIRSEEHTSELQSHSDLVCRLLLEKKKVRSAASKNDNSSFSNACRFQVAISCLAKWEVGLMV